jgi:8-oxo-dGTP pyrophosphatase MutT (NUDIX family)
METSDLDAAFARYAERHPGQAALAAEYRDFLASHPAVFERAHVAGHFTGSAWVVSADGERVLLTHHRKLDLWLQLGGHADGDRDLVRAALKEAQEESGLTGLAIESQLFDLDRHWIPEHKGVPAHWHYDVRYVVRAMGGETFMVSDESHDLAWREIAALVDDEAADASLRRMAGKWMARSP